MSETADNPGRDYNELADDVGELRMRLIKLSRELPQDARQVTLGVMDATISQMAELQRCLERAS